MKRMSTALLAAALTCSLAPLPAYALGNVASQRASMAQPSAGQQLAAIQQGQTGLTSGYLDIREPGTYVLEGNMRGTVRVNPGTGDVRLIMNNAVIDGNGGPAIQAISGDSLTIMMPEGSNSRVLSSGIGNAGASGNIGRGTIQSSVDTFFEGPGNLMVVGNRQPGILTNNASITFNGGAFQFFSAGDGMAAEGTRPGTLTVNDGNFVFGLDGGIMSPNTNVVRNGGSFEWSNSMPNFDYSAFAQANPWNGGQNATQVGQPNQLGHSARLQTGQLEQGAAPQAPDQQSMQHTGSSTTAGTIVAGTTTNSAASLSADYSNATTYDVSEESQVKITTDGTYVVTGTSSDGNITVKKGTTGVVLVLSDLDLTSTSGATVSVNKEAEVKIIVSGNVVLTDNENPDDENSTDASVADAYDGAALKAKANSQVFLTGDGMLTINGNAKNGIKTGDDASLVIDGTTLNISAVNDGINANYDLSVLSGNVTIEAGDDAIHADRILTIGADGTGPTINITNSTEGLEGTVVNIQGGDVHVTSSDDAINAANADAAYEGELDYSINMTGGSVNVNSGGDGMDSNGNVNLVGGSMNISSASGGGEAGIDYDGDLYVSDEFQLNNNSGVAGPDSMGGMNVGMGARQVMGGMNGGIPGQASGQPGRR